MATAHQTDWYSRWALYRPHHVAVEEAFSGRSLTWLELERAASALARHLREERGVGKGDRVAVLAENGIPYLVLFGAAQKLGFILVPLNYRLAAPELAYLLRDADPALVLVQDLHARLLDEALEGLPVPVADLALVESLTEAEKGRVQEPFPAVALEHDDPVFILYTSGTTGFPKGALYTHGMLFWNSVNTAMSLTVNTESRTVQCLPPFHTGGWNVLQTPFLHHGGYVCLMPRFEPAEVLRLLQEKRATLFMGVPTMLRLIAEESAFAKASFPDLLYLIVGGEPMPVPLIETWDAKGVKVRQGYGLTEVGPNLTSLHQDDAIRRKGSIGRPNFYVQTRLCDERGREAGAGERGELWLRGPMVTPGYWRNPEATAAAFTEGWFRTGDVLVRDEEDYLFVVDRLKHLYISGGENVYPAEVERVLVQHPAVAEAAVVAVPDPVWGEAGHAFLRCAGEPPDPEALKDWCREKLARYKVPKYVTFTEEIPKNDTGKVNRRLLGQRAQAIVNPD